jgi:multiple sugar transport system substrate-binding protein
MTARLGLAMLFLVAGCARRPAPTAIVLHIASWGQPADDSAYTKEIEQIYREFERENPGVKVEAEIVPDMYAQKMVLDHVAGVSPDVMVVDDASSATFINNGLIESLTPFIERDQFDTSIFFPNVLAIDSRGSAIYAIPIDFTPLVVYYNKRFFDAAKTPYPDGSWSFAEFRQTALRLTRDGTYGYAFANWMPGWITWIWNSGGDVLALNPPRAEGTLDTPENAATIGFLRDLIEKYHVSPSPSQTNAMGIDPFASGKAAMTISGHWSMIDYRNAPKDATGQPLVDWRELGVCGLPHDTPNVRSPLYEAGYAIPVGGKHEELAWKFIKYMTSASVQLRYNSSGIAIDARRDVAQARASDPLERQFLPLVTPGRAPIGASVVGYDFVETRGTSAMASVLENGVPPLSALQRAAKRIDQEFAKR